MLYLSTAGIEVIRQAGEDSPVAMTTMTATVNSIGGQTGNNTSNPTIVNQTGNLNGWVNPLNLLTGANTTTTLFGSSSAVNTSNALQITGFNFIGIPNTANVLGIIVNITEQKLSGTSAVLDSSVILLGVASNSKNSITPWNSSPTVASYGSPTDLWGNIAIVGADVNSQQFGVQLIIDCTLLPGDGAVAAVSGVSITVFWQTSAGNIAAGTYNINVVYETDTGFLTPPATSPNVAITVVVPSDNSSITLNNIPTSPDVPYVIARFIIIALQDSLGDVGTYYFIPSNDGGVLTDNISTTTTLSFFVTDLVESADYLFNLYARIPAGQNIDVYAARLQLLGFMQPDASILRLSNSGDPETFDQTETTIVVNKDDGYFVSNTVILNDILYIFKFKGVFATQDNGGPPTTWQVDNIDDSVGCGFKGISTVSPTKNKGSGSGLVLMADISGVYLFNGYIVRPPLTWKIQDIWDTLTDITNVRITIDVENNRFHITGF